MTKLSSSIADRFAWLQAVVRARTTATALRAAVAIAAHMNAARGETWPSLAMLAAWCGLDKRNVTTAVRALERAGLLVVAERGGPRRSRRYRLPAVCDGTPLRCAPEHLCGVSGNTAAVFAETPEHVVNAKRQRSEHGGRAASRARSAGATRAARRAPSKPRLKPF